MRSTLVSMLLALAIGVTGTTAAQGGRACEKADTRQLESAKGCARPALRQTRLSAAATGFRLGTLGVPATPILH